MRYEYYQPNPVSTNEDDCVIRAICKATGKDWDTVYMELCAEGMKRGTWGNVNHVWDSYLRNNGYERYAIPNTCPECYTVGQFAEEHTKGIYTLATGSHAVTIQDDKRQTIKTIPRTINSGDFIWTISCPSVSTFVSTMFATRHNTLQNTAICLRCEQ